MTDISNWADSIFIMQTPYKNPWNDKEEGGPLTSRIMVPLNEYQMGNLIDAISQVSDTGDWWGEFCAIIARAMKVADIKELRSNRGYTYTREQVESGAIRKPPTQGPI